MTDCHSFSPFTTGRPDRCEWNWYLDRILMQRKERRQYGHSDCHPYFNPQDIKQLFHEARRNRSMSWREPKAKVKGEPLNPASKKTFPLQRLQPVLSISYPIEAFHPSWVQIHSSLSSGELTASSVSLMSTQACVSILILSNISYQIFYCFFEI